MWAPSQLNLSLGFPTRFDTNQAVQPQYMVKRLGVWDLGRIGIVLFMYWKQSHSSVHSYSEADLLLSFFEKNMLWLLTQAMRNLFSCHIRRLVTSLHIWRYHSELLFFISSAQQRWWSDFKDLGADLSLLWFTFSIYAKIKFQNERIPVLYKKFVCRKCWCNCRFLWV